MGSRPLVAVGLREKAQKKRTKRKEIVEINYLLLRELSNREYTP